MKKTEITSDNIYLTATPKNDWQKLPKPCDASSLQQNMTISQTNNKMVS